MISNEALVSFASVSTHHVLIISEPVSRETSIRPPTEEGTVIVALSPTLYVFLSALKLNILTPFLSPLSARPLQPGQSKYIILPVLWPLTGSVTLTRKRPQSG